MVDLPNEIKSLAGIDDKVERQLSKDIVLVLQKMVNGQVPTPEERQLLINPTEAGAIASIKSGRAVTHRYIKEIARPRIKKDGSPKKRRLEPAKVAGKTSLYFLGDVYDLEPIISRPGRKKTIKDTSAAEIQLDQK